MQELARRGVADGTVDIRAFAFDAAAPEVERVISCDVPFSADQLRSIHAGGGTVLITPVERAHLRRIAAEVPFTLKQRAVRDVDTGALDAFRDTIRTAVASEDLDAQ